MTSTLTKLPRLNAPTVRVLPSGLTIIAEQMPVEAVNLSLWLNVGSCVESDAINGMAHFLEHMVFKGTNRLPAGEFERLIEERGAVTNAATSQDYTHYYITTAPQDFATLAPLQIEVVLNPSIPDDAFERERMVVLEEIRRSDDSPRRRIYQQTMEVGFESLPYRRPVLGPEFVIEDMQPQQMRDFHRCWYQPRSMTAVAVGNLPVDELIEIIANGVAESSQDDHNTAFSQGFAKGLPHNQLRPNWQKETAFTEVVRHEYTDETLQQARLIMLWRVPGLQDLQDTYGLDVLTAVLSHGRMSRLVRDLREERGLVSSISVSNLNYQLQGLFYISAHCPVENLQVVEALILEHIQRLQSELVSFSEIERIRKRVANRFIFGNETPGDRAGLYGYYQALVGDLEPAFDYPHHIQAIDAEDLQQAAQIYLPTDAYGVVVVKPS